MKTPILWALLLAIRPIRAMERSDALGWAGSWLVHAVGVFGGMLSLPVLLEWVDRPGGGLMRAIGRVSRDAMRLPHQAGGWWLLLAELAVSGLAFEVGWVLASLSASAWVARDEGVGASVGRAIQRGWRATPWVVMTGVVAIGSAAMMGWAIESGWRGTDWYNRPYIFRNIEMLQAVLSVTLAAAGGWVLLASMAAGRWGARCRWPMHCESCGYNLFGVPSTGSVAAGPAACCPECGQRVPGPMDERYRPGSLLRLHRAHPWRGLALTLFWPVIVPRSFGRLLRPHEATDGHGWFAFGVLTSATAAGPVYILAALAVIGILHNLDPLSEVRSDADKIVAAGWTLGTLLAGATVGVMLATGTLVGLLRSWQSGRNLLRHAGLGSAHAVTLLYVWGTGFWVLAVVLAVVEQRYRDVWRHLLPTFGIELAAITLTLLWTGVVAIWHGVATWRIVGGCRHANV